MSLPLTTKLKTFARYGAALVFALSSIGREAGATGIYTQIVLPFPTERRVESSYEKSENALVLSFEKTAPSELPALDQYDERLVKRVLIKDHGPIGTEVKLIMRDRNVRAIVNRFTEPFRISIDLFEAGYAEDKDPVTGLPMAGSAGAAANPGAAVGGGGNSNTAKGQLLVEDDTAAIASGSGAAGGTLKLLAPVPKIFETPEEMTMAMRDAAEGIGQAWKTYPPYVYRLQTATYEEGMAKSGPSSVPTSVALSSSRAMADYAGKLFNMGHEGRALIAYQQVLHREPSLFDHDALHLWKFAEVHLGQGNLTLARGYYEALVDKHPESPLAQFAKLRILDVAAVRLLQQDKYTDLPSLVPSLDGIKARTTGELSAQIAIRRAYWDKPGMLASYDAKAIPKIASSVRTDLAAAYPTAENSKTALLAANLILADMLKPETPWQRSTGQFAEAYFKRFAGDATEPWRTNLRNQVVAKLNGNLQKKVADGKLLEAIDDYESVPKTLRSLSDGAQTAWALAEAYRKLGQTEKSVELYAAAAKGGSEGPERFKAQFWLAVGAGDASLNAAKANPARSDALAKLAHDADRRMEASWQRLKDDERRALVVSYKEPFEKTISGKFRLKTPPKIVLDSWTAALGTKRDANNGAAPAATEWDKAFSPSGSAVILFTDLGQRFGELGIAPERKKAISLLKNLKPKEFGDDKAAKEIWSNQLAKLAEDQRKAGDYLEAGRLYSLVGDGSENWEGRAEALYKGGLLLFRAGRREEAMAAFKKSSEDGNNLFYANLAKERLAQLQ